MMTETVTLITPSDVLSVGFECSACGATYFVPLVKLTGALPGKCQNCGAVWLYEPSVAMVAPTDARVLAGFVNALQELQARPFGAAVRLELAQPHKEAQ